MSRPSGRNDPRTHYSLHQASSIDGFFKLNSPKSETAVPTADKSNLVKANQNQLRAKLRDGQSTESSTTSTG
ncbi:hypothetical protein A2U01_0090356, partial [Trifolium medium]|nr:hypothetical protein [Trifolium medium]